MDMSKYIAEALVRNRMKKMHESKGDRAPKEYLKAAEDILNHQLGEYETGVRVLGGRIIYEGGPGRPITLKVEYSVDIQIPIVDPEDKQTYYENETEYRSKTMTLEINDELEEAGRIVTGRDERGNLVNWYDDDSFISDEDMRNADPNPGRDPDYIEDMEEDLTIDDDPEETEQKYSSAATSINSSKLPALFKLVDFEEGSINLDYGGGRFDNVAEYLEKEYGATNLVYDKYNRTAEHNKTVLNQIRQNGGADTVTCSNVLNVIAEESERLAVLRNCKRYLKSGGTCYITVYTGDRSGEGRATKSGYQMNRDTKDYIDEIKRVFSSVERKGKLIIAR